MSQEESRDEDSAGNISFRKKDKSKIQSQNAPPFSWALDEEQSVPIQSQFDEGSNEKFFRSPPRSLRSSSQRQRGTPSSSRTSNFDDFSLPPEMQPENDSSFKSWLTSGILGALNVAAGVTISTTGTLMAPPLHVTKTVLLPGLLALFIDTLDATTPQRIKDWFRILSSSVYHLFSVLRSTSSGKKFSSQFWIVLKDVMGALSSPESRQLLVDGVACSVKFADALNTPEVHAWIDHMVLLGCRLVDAAASGKTKQLLHNTKDLAWNGIEMATDPATTLALAEVTAHLCHALEDAQHSLEPTKRAQRNAQNQATYLDPLQMSDLPKQVPIERIILSSLGRYEESDLRSEGNVPADVIWKDEVSLTEIRDWKDHQDQVNIALMKEKILSTPRQRRNSHSSEISAEQSSDPSHPTPEMPPLAQEHFGDNEIAEGKSTKHNGTDMEDLNWQKIPNMKKVHTSRERLRVTPKLDSSDEPAVSQFYRTLDDLLEQKKASKEGLTQRRIQPPQIMTDSGQEIESWNLLKAKVKKLKEGTEARAKERSALRERKKNSFQQLPTVQKRLFQVITLVIVLLCLSFVGFGIYGMYAFKVKMRSNYGRATSSAAADNSEVVIRVIREVVHVGEDGTMIKSSLGSTFSKEERDALANCVYDEAISSK